MTQIVAGEDSSGTPREIRTDSSGRITLDPTSTITATVDESTLATSANQTNNNQKAKVTDQPLDGHAEGHTTAGADAALFTSQTGGGTVLIVNTSATDTAYLTFSGATADNTKFPLPPGAAIDGLALSDVTHVRCFSSASPVLGWAIFQVA